jgi:hypothetical protein
VNRPPKGSLVAVRELGVECTLSILGIEHKTCGRFASPVYIGTAAQLK